MLDSEHSQLSTPSSEIYTSKLNFATMAETTGKSSVAEQHVVKGYKYNNVMIMDEVEDLEYYEPGGLAPLDVGDTIGGRFYVFWKLGYGGIATVWLCWEEATEQWRAIKVNAARYSSEDCPDLVAIQHMKEQGVSREQLEANHIIMPYETFWEETPNGRHLCSVLPVLGPKLIEWRSEVLSTDTERVDNLCYQVVEGLSFMHSKGLCHGDFRPSNILMKLKPGCFDNVSRDDMWELLGGYLLETADVWTTTNERSEHAPKEVVTSAAWQRFQEFVMDDVAIVDFGEAYKASEPPKEFGIPPVNASPEVIFEKGQVGFRSDVWSLATALLEVRLDRHGRNTAPDAIRCMERFIGPVPHYYRSEARKILLDDDWDIPDEEGDEEDKSYGSASKSLRPLTGPLDLPIDDEEERDFETSDYTDLLERRLGTEQLAWGTEPDPRDPTGEEQRVALIPYHLSRDEVLNFAHLLRQMLKYIPEERISASQVLAHRWFRKQQHSKVSNFLCDLYPYPA